MAYLSSRGVTGRMLAGEHLTEKNILSKIRIIYHDNYGTENTDTVEMVLSDTIDLFKGKRKGFEKCDLVYHNLFHTLQTIPPFVEIVDGWNKSRSTPWIEKKYFDYGIIAVLMHDTGYMKKEGDKQGTGAKYTFTHIQRSIDFADAYLRHKGFDSESISCVANAIRCTGVNPAPEEIPFTSDEGRIIGYALGTADLLGQMASPDYVQKLPLLFAEFDEAYRHDGIGKIRHMGIKVFNNAEELFANTEHFYRNIAMERMASMGSVHRFIPYHFKIPNNPYTDAIEENMRRIKDHL